MKSTNKLLIALSVLSASTFALAGNVVDANTNAALKHAEEQLKVSYSNFTMTHMAESEVEGLFEVHTSSGMIYYHPEADILFFGHIYNSEGQNLTLASLKRESAKRIKNNSDLFKDAISFKEVKDAQLVMYEFSNPDCGYCAESDKWFKSYVKAKDLKIDHRYIFTHNGNFDESQRDRMEHVICSEDRQKAWDERHTVTEYKKCDEAKDILASHEKVAKTLGVNGTPTFVFKDGTLISGLKTKELDEYISSKTSK